MFVVIGEALIDLVGQRGGRTLAAHPGGSPANVALGLARLGVPVTLKTRLRRDAFGEMISAHLEASGVRVDGGPDGGVSTSLAIATLAAGIASYDFRIDWDVGPLEPLPGPATLSCGWGPRLLSGRSRCVRCRVQLHGPIVQRMTL